MLEALFSRKKKTEVADAAPTPCRRITIPNDGWKAGQVVRLTNYTDERKPWISDLLRRSEACADPGDDLCTTFDVETMNPAVADFNPPALPNYTRREICELTGWDSEQLNYAMDAHVFLRPVPCFISEPGSGFGKPVVDIEEHWLRYEADKNIAHLQRLRLCPNAMARR